MSRKSPAEFSEMFDQSATPKSPEELDKRILEYARRNVPQPTRRRQPLFLTAAATLSVAGLGLLVVLRSGDPTLPLSRPQPAPSVAPAADRQTTQAVSDGAAEQKDEVLATVSQYEPGLAVRKKRVANSKRAVADKDLTSAQASSKPAKSITAKAATAVRESSRMAAPESLEQATVQQALVAHEEKAKPPTKHTKTKLGNEAMRESLQEIRKLHAAGKTSEAEKAYRKLRERCGDCDLPESLKRALATMDAGFKK